MLEKIISGGQSGADIAAVNAAITVGFPYGGMIPKGRKWERGTLSVSYTEFTESKSPDYIVRTEANVIRSDGTLIFTKGMPTGGTAATIRLVRKHKKPFLLVDVDTGFGFSSIEETIIKFIEHHGIRVLNVAGPRESKTPEIYDAVYAYILKVLKICK